MISENQNWMSIRRNFTTGAAVQAVAEGLTGFTVLERQGKKVALEGCGEFTEFISCSYLGLEAHPALIEAATKAMQKTGIHLSSSRSAMRPKYLGELEVLLGEIYTGSSVSVFTSTSNVHLGVLPLLGAGALPTYPVRRSVRWLIDKTAHASMQVLRGILQQFGAVSRVDASDVDALTGALIDSSNAGETPVLLVDGVGSMNNLVVVSELSQSLKGFGGYVYVDDAHGISIIGEHGAGYAFSDMKSQLPDNVILAGSLSKGFGGAGGFVVLSSASDIAVVNDSANPLVFGHSIMVPMLAANVASAEIHLSNEIIVRQKNLWRNVDYFDELTDGRMLNFESKSPVRGASFLNEVEGLRAARVLREKGVIVFPVFYPIVASGQSMLRFAFSSDHEESDIKLLVDALTDAGVFDS
jgi:7-keto-8-aminopelargonate synthetase-like enzyme